MKPEKARELIVVLIHLALWSELGVLTRIYLDRFFSGACSGSFGVCLTSDGAHHPPCLEQHACNLEMVVTKPSPLDIGCTDKNTSRARGSREPCMPQVSATELWALTSQTCPPTCWDPSSWACWQPAARWASPMANSWPSCQSPTAGRSVLSAAWAPAPGSHMTPARLASTNAKRLAQRRGA